MEHRLREFICNEAMVDIAKLQRGDFTENELDRVVEAIEILRQLVNSNWMG